MKLSTRLRRLVRMDKSSEYVASVDDAAEQAQQRHDRAQQRYDKQIAEAQEMIRRAEQELNAELTAADTTAHQAHADAVADLDERLRVEVGARPDARLRRRRDGVIELCTDDHGPAIASMDSRGGQFWVDTPDGGRAWIGSYEQARRRLWGAARPMAR